MRIIIKKLLAKKRKVYVAFMDLEMDYDWIDWEAVWDVLKADGVGAKSLNEEKAVYIYILVHMLKVKEVDERFTIHRYVRQGYIISSWLFSLFICSLVYNVL